MQIVLNKFDASTTSSIDEVLIEELIPDLPSTKLPIIPTQPFLLDDSTH